ncbi:unnamed protein product [Pieris brassicae]|uniref:PAP-associated domain-containing protein n=2 Tax=Pieris brassicae TaxID=7116 RepID=A0A9P0TBH0_PIEBR|nr:unnamed protein product [Pieris brassicae]
MKHYNSIFDLKRYRGNMSEGESVICHGKNGFSAPRVGQGQNIDRQCHNHQHFLAQMVGVANRGGGSPRQGQRRWQDRDKQHQKDMNSPFGYESDDSSLSSNASGSNGSNKSSENDGKRSSSSSGSNTVTREWRSRNRRDHRPRRLTIDRFNSSFYPFEVKFAPDDLLNGSQWDTLSQEIWDKFIKSQQTEATFHNKMQLWRYLYGTVRTIFPRYGLYVVGSTMTGFGLESSDMDLCLYVRSMGHVEPRAHALLHLDYILSFIRAFDPDAELIQAKVPILKFRDAYSGVQVDLNCNNVVGIRNTNMLYAFSIGDWRVRPLVAVAKLWARAHRINDARRRTLSSYALTLMVIHFLQCGTNPWILPRVPEVCEKPPRSQNRLTLGELFLQFLKYYADFPYDQMAVSVRAGRRIPIAECRYSHLDPHQWKHICVEEPFDLTNTARSVYDPETFEKIVKAFRDSHRRLAPRPRLAEAWPQAR